MFDGLADKDAGPRSCLTPGACGGWLELLERYGRMTPAQVFAPAIDLAENGYAVTVKNSQSMTSGGKMNDRAESVILSRGHGPLPGEILIQKDLARTFRRIAEGGAEVFYRGDLAREMAGYIQGEGGWLSERDLADFEPEWVDPLVDDLSRFMRCFARHRRVRDFRFSKRSICWRDTIWRRWNTTRSRHYICSSKP